MNVVLPGWFPKFYYFHPFWSFGFCFVLIFNFIFSRKLQAKLMLIIAPKNKINDVGNSEMPKRIHKVLLSETLT